MKQLLTTFLFVCIGLVSFAQPDVLITDADYTSNGQGDCACSTDFNNGSVQNFHDSGGLGADYGANENDTITFCPDGTGSKVFIAFGINTGYTLDVDVSDTIFLFTFSSCLFFLLKFIYKNDSVYSLYLSALFLGVSTFIRAATFPLIFLSIPIIYLVIRSHTSSNKKIFISLIFFVLISLIPVSYRWVIILYIMILIH